MKRKMTVIKTFALWNFEKEEKWLNEMALKGWVLDKIRFGVYCFVRSEPGEYAIRLELHKREKAYVTFMEETGAEFIGLLGNWHYFRKKSVTGIFDIFSDIDSRIEHLKRISRFSLNLVILFILTTLLNIVVYMPLFNEDNTSLYKTLFAIDMFVSVIMAAFFSYNVGVCNGKKDELNKERLLRE